MSEDNAQESTAKNCPLLIKIERVTKAEDVEETCTDTCRGRCARRNVRPSANEEETLDKGEETDDTIQDVIDKGKIEPKIKPELQITSSVDVEEAQPTSKRSFMRIKSRTLPRSSGTLKPLRSLMKIAGNLATSLSSTLLTSESPRQLTKEKSSSTDVAYDSAHSSPTLANVASLSDEVSPIDIKDIDGFEAADSSSDRASTPTPTPTPEIREPTNCFFEVLIIERHGNMCAESKARKIKVLHRQTKRICENGGVYDETFVPDMLPDLDTYLESLDSCKSIGDGDMPDFKSMPVRRQQCIEEQKKMTLMKKLFGKKSTGH